MYPILSVFVVAVDLVNGATGTRRILLLPRCKHGFGVTDGVCKSKYQGLTETSDLKSVLFYDTFVTQAALLDIGLTTMACQDKISS